MQVHLHPQIVDLDTYRFDGATWVRPGDQLNLGRGWNIALPDHLHWTRITPESIVAVNAAAAELVESQILTVTVSASRTPEEESFCAEWQD